MLQVSDADIEQQHKNFISKFNDISKAPFMQDDFIRKAFPVLEKRAAKKYPYDVKIPKNINSLRLGDFEPAKVIHVTEPFKGPWSNIWFGDASKEIRFRTGYRNGDSRYISDQGFYDTFVHGLMGGATGQGKSVTLNEIIFNLCMEYPPWELHLILSDAKIVEFKSIAMQHPMPHITAVSATGDADYLISLLQSKQQDMLVMNSIFSEASRQFGHTIKKVEEFREVTGLCLPRNVIIFDEFQAMFKNAKKKAGLILSLIDSFGRLGRNTGYHIFLTSQEIGSDLPQGVLNQISLRAAVGCSEDVSRMILGNDAAVKNKGKYGRLLFNLQHDKHEPKTNVLVRVPFMNAEQMSKISGATIGYGKKLDIMPVMQFYDDEALYYEKKYYEFVDSLPYNEDCVYLGEPAFILDSPIRCLALNFGQTDCENIFVITINNSGLERYFKILSHSIRRNPHAQNIVMCANNMFASRCKADEFAGIHYYEETNYSKSIALEIARNVIYRRLLCLQVDGKVFSESHACHNDISDTLFYSVFDKDSPEDTVVNRNRCYHIMGFLEADDSFQNAFGISASMSADSRYEKKKNIVKGCIQLYFACGCELTCMSFKDLPKVFVWILSADRILGLGRDPNSRNISALKSIMMDSAKANVRFIVFTSTMEDITDLRNAVRWYVLDGIDDREISRIKLTDDYPDTVPGGLAVCKDVKEPQAGCLKFKKMFLEGEMPPA